MTAFVILHYRAIDTTRSCVKSIRALAGDKHIVIVDNASPNGTGAVLAIRVRHVPRSQTLPTRSMTVPVRSCFPAKPLPVPFR